MDAASDLHPPISACRFDVLVQLSRKLRPIRCLIVPSSVRVSQNFFLSKWMPRREFSFALIALASQFRAPARSGLTLFQPQQFAPKFPAQVDAASAIAFCLDATTAALSHVQVSSFARLSDREPKISEPNGCRSRIATFTCVSVSLPFPSDPVGPPSVRPFAHSIRFLLRLPAEAARHSKLAPDSVSANAPAEALQGINLCHGLVFVFGPCPQPHGPHLSLGGSGLCSNLCSTCHRAASSAVDSVTPAALS